MEDRKKDHISLAFDSDTGEIAENSNVYYEPMLASHPQKSELLRKFTFINKEMKFPLWISSMTGGTKLAEVINRNLARACREYGLGMGLGSCRILLEDESRFHDFDVRQYMDDSCPLYINMGIAQIEEMLRSDTLDRVQELNRKLRADGMIIHVNPLQEWIQPEGDTIYRPPIDTIAEAVDKLELSVIVKEVGQGFGPDSMEQLMKLPIDAIDFAAAGGTNFSRLEMMRNRDKLASEDEVLATVGHSARAMTQFANRLKNQSDIIVNQFIISGGVKNYLDAYELIETLEYPAVYGMASPLLRHARGEYEDLQKYIMSQINGYRLVEKYMTVKTKDNKA